MVSKRKKHSEEINTLLVTYRVRKRKNESEEDKIREWHGEARGKKKSEKNKEKRMFKRIKNERKMQIREKRKHRLVNNPEKTQESRKKEKHNTGLTLIVRRSRTGTVWFYTSTSNKRPARPKLYTKSLTRDLKLMYSRFTLVRISINL